MKTKMFLTSIALVSIVFMGCKSNDPTTNNDNPGGIPAQNTQ